MLNLEKCDITNEGLGMLAENRYLGNLESIDISKNPNLQISQFLEEFSECSMFDNLKTMYVQGSGLSDAELETLTKEYTTLGLKNTSMVSTVLKIDVKTYFERVYDPKIMENVPLPETLIGEEVQEGQEGEVVAGEGEGVKGE